jgi:hypothetical protein
MRLRERLQRWWKPARWREDHPPSAEEYEESRHVDRPDGYMEPQSGMLGVDSYERVDVERDLREP